MHNFFSLLPLSVSFFHTFLLIYISLRRQRTDMIHMTFIVLGSMLSLWTFCDFLLWSGFIPPSFMMRFALLQSLAWMPLGLVFLIFIYLIVKRPMDWIIGIVALFCVVSFIISIKYNTMIIALKPEIWGIRQVFSLHFYLHTFLGLFLPFLFALILVKKMLQRGEQLMLAKPLYLLLTSMGVLLGVGVFYDLLFIAILQFPWIQLSAISSVIFSLTMLTAVTRYEFITINQQQVNFIFDQIFDFTNEGIILVGNEGNIVQSNNSALTLLGIKKGLLVDHISEFMPACKGNSWDKNRCEFTRNGKRIAGSRSSVKQKNDLVAEIYILHDTTIDKQFEERLYRVNTQIAEQNQFNYVRADLWQMASDVSLTEEALIQKLLDTIGPVLGVSRASYNVLEGEKFTCTIEWCRVGVDSTIGSSLPFKIIKYFLHDTFSTLDYAGAIKRLPGVIRPFARVFLKKLFKRQNITSIAYMPCKIYAQQEGGIIFDICCDLVVIPEWTTQKRQLVQDAISIIGLVIEQRRTAKALENSHNDLEERVQDRTIELKTSLSEKEVLLKEIHHRVKNNLQVISSLLSLQSRHLQDPQDTAMFIDSQNRIKSMALIHERLYQTGDLGQVRFDSYIARLVVDLFHTYMIDSGKITCVQDIDPVAMTIDRAIPCSLIVNELVSNALKHAFKDTGKGTLTIQFKIDKEQEDSVVLTVHDDGPGLSQTFAAEDADTLGLQLVYTLADQLDGELTVTNIPGACFSLRFPLATI